MRIHLYYQYFHNPDCAAASRHFHLVQYLSKRHEITVITSDIWENKRITNHFEWAPDGVQIESIRAPYENNMGRAKRLFAFIRYMFGAFIKGIRLPKPDIIIGTSTPLSAAWIAGKIARMRGIPWVFEVRDLWPDFPIQMGAIPFKWMKKWLWKIEKNMYKTASHVIPLSPDMHRHIQAKGISNNKITTLINGTDYELARQSSAVLQKELRQAYALEGKKIVLYAGTLGRANAIESILEIAELLEADTEIQFILIGEGYYQQEVIKYASKLGNILFLPPVPRHKIFDWYALADLSLVPFLQLPVLDANSPAKFFDSLSVGTPVLVTNSGWTRTFVEENDCGWVCANLEPESLATCIRTIMGNPELLMLRGQNGAIVADKCFQRTSLFNQFEQILMHCIKYPLVSA